MLWAPTIFTKPIFDWLLSSHGLRNYFVAELSRQNCEIRDLLKCKSRLALDKATEFKGLRSCIILIL